MMELICEYNKVVGYKVTNERLSHKTWAPQLAASITDPCNWVSYAKNRPLFSGNLEATDFQVLHLPLWRVACMSGRE